MGEHSAASETPNGAVGTSEGKVIAVDMDDVLWYVHHLDSPTGGDAAPLCCGRPRDSKVKAVADIATVRRTLPSLSVRVYTDHENHHSDLPGSRGG
jgi:hypothetical protein